MDKYHSEDIGLELRPPSIWIRVQLVVDYLFYLLYGLIGLQIILQIAGAHEGSGFKQFLNKVTYLFLNPFEGLFPDLVFRGPYRLRISYAVALVIYLLLHLAVLGLFKLIDKNRRLS